MILRELDSGRTLQVERGELIILRLAENPTTGYRWGVESSQGLELIDDQNTFGEGLGAGGLRVLQFRSRRSGECELRLKHWREWEGEGSVIGRFQVNLVVE